MNDSGVWRGRRIPGPALPSREKLMPTRARCYGLATALSLTVLAAVLAANEYVRDLTKPKGSGPFFQICRAAKWGFMDVLGNTVIQPQFDDEGHFFNGLARVRVGRLWGFINESGRVVIPPRFDAAGDFQEALAPVRVGKKWGYISQDGKMLVAPAFQGAAAFREGLARVEIWDRIRCGQGLLHTKDDAPDYVYSVQSDIPHDINNTCFPLDSKVGYINNTGRFVIPARFAEAHDFFDGLAVVRIDPSEFGKYGFIDRLGTVVIGFQFDEARGFSEGLAAVRVGRRKATGIRDPGRSGYVDRLGKFVIAARFAEAGDFSEGLAPVSFWDREGRGYIDKSGRLAIPARYTWAGPFSEGLAETCLAIDATSWRCVYIDHHANIAISTVQAYGPFSGGLAIAQDKTAEVYIDKTGRPIAQSQTETAPPATSRRN